MSDVLTYEATALDLELEVEARHRRRRLQNLRSWMTPHDGQQRVLDEARRFNVLNCGRRFGKTQLGIYLLADPETLTYPQGWFAPTYKFLLEAWDAAAYLFRDLLVKKNKTEGRMWLSTGGVIDFWTMDKPDAGRGRKYKRIIIDEAAMVKRLLQEWRRSLRATLADYVGDAWFLSTPKGRNAFHTLFYKGQDAHEREWSSWQMPTHTNPHIPPSEIDAMEQEMSAEAFAQEVLAQFVTFEGMVYPDWRVVEVEPTGGEVAYGFDFGNRVPSALVRVTRRDTPEGWVYTVHELLYGPHLSTPDMIAFMQTAGVRRNASVWCDHEGDRILELARAGFDAKRAKKDVAAGLEFVKRRQHRLCLTRSSRNLIDEIEQYAWAVRGDGTEKDEPLKIHDHGMDAMRYAIYSEWGHPRPKPPRRAGYVRGVR